MATIALYASKINQMPGLVREMKRTVTDYKAELAALKKKTLKINKSVCNLDDVIQSIQASTQLQEQKSDSLDTMRQNSEDFTADVIRIDGNVADVVNQRKDDFYSKYNYLKPEYEKSGWEKFKDGCKDAGAWCKEHWKAIATVVIVIVAVVLVCTGIGGIIGAMALGALFGAGIGGLLGGIMSAAGGGSFWEGFENGAFSGAIAGIISGGMGFGLTAGGSPKIILSLAQKLLIGGVSGAGTSVVSDLGDIVFKGADLSFGQVLGNILVSGTIGALFAGAGHGISKSLSTLFKNVSWFSNAKELFRIGTTEKPAYGIITSYTTKNPQGISVNFANKLGNCLIRFEFDAKMFLHYHRPSVFSSKGHIPLGPILDAILSGSMFNFLKNKKQS